jgi:arabinan endo-1,5-alpha-L-arabinosidase
MKRRLFLLRASILGIASALGLRARAQTTNTTDTNAAASTNAAPRRGRNNGPPRNYPAGEVERLVKLGNRGIGVHDPSTMIKCKDDYWVFYTGNGVPSWHSKDLVHWEAGPHVFSQTPEWVREAVPRFRGNGFWAPDISFVGDRYCLYFAASSFGKNGSAIGLATNPTLDPDDPNYKWTDEGLVVKSVGRDDSPTPDDYNTIDPAIIHDADGGLWLAFGSFWKGIELIQLDPKTGKRIKPDSVMYTLAHYATIEASFIYYHDGYYYLFVNWGFCCRGANSTYEIRIGRCKDIIGPYLDQDGKDMLYGGGTKFLGTAGAFIGPGHAGILKDGDKFWFSCHFYDGTTPRGASFLDIRPLTWGADGWPVAGEMPS